MSENPSDYYVGLLDFFGILIPGAVAVALLRLSTHDWMEAVKTRLDLTPPAPIAAFVVLSFLTGYLLNVVSVSLDRFTERRQHRAFQRTSGAGVFKRASELRDIHLPAPDRRLIPTYLWARSSVRALSSAWASEIDRLDAHTALFRSMTLVFALAAFVGFFVEPRYTHSFIHNPWHISLIFLVIAAVCFLMFKHLRWQRIQMVYQYCIVLNASTATKSPDSAEESSN